MQVKMLRRVKRMFLSTFGRLCCIQVGKIHWGTDNMLRLYTCTVLFYDGFYIQFHSPNAIARYMFAHEANGLHQAGWNVSTREICTLTCIMMQVLQSMLLTVPCFHNWAKTTQTQWDYQGIHVSRAMLRKTSFTIIVLSFVSIKYHVNYYKRHCRRFGTARLTREHVHIRARCDKCELSFRLWNKPHLTSDSRFVLTTRHMRWEHT